MHEVTQLQRQIETKIRQYKDKQIGSKAVDNTDEIYHCQEKIKQLTDKYYDLHKVSGLPTKIDRLRVDGYRSVKLNNNNILGVGKEHNINSKKEFVEVIDLKDLKEKISSYEDSICNNNYESAFVIKKNGEVYKFSGEDKSVRVFDVDLNEAIITHNHPPDDGIYRSFGEDDFTFMKNNSIIKSLRITTPIYEFEINIKRI